MEQNNQNSPSAHLSAKELNQKSVRGGKQTFINQVANFFIHMASTVIVARFLGPEEYGIVAMVTSITLFASLFKDLGLSSVTVQKKSLTTEQHSNLFWVNLIAGTTLGGIVACASPLVAYFYGRPELQIVTLVLSSNFIIKSLGTQHSANLVRRMEFGKRSVADISGNVVSLLSSLAFAYFGYGYWALVYSSLLSNATTTILLFYYSPLKIVRPAKKTGLKEMMKFGINVTGFEILNYFSRNLDNILIGKYIGADALGLYNRAYRLMMFPITNLRNPINAVIFPALSKLQDRDSEYRTYFRNAITLLAALTTPVVALLYIVSSPLINVLLGPDWSQVSTLFSIMAIVAFTQPTASQIGTILLTLGKSKKYLQLGLFNSIITSIGFVIGLNWGAEGIAWSYVITRYAALIPNILFCTKGSPIGIRDFFDAMAIPSCISITAAALTKLAISILPFQSDIEVLSLSVITFSVLTYFLASIATYINSGFRNTIDASKAAKFLVLRKKTTSHHA